MSYLNATCVSGLSILVSMLHVPLISPLCVLSQYRMCLWFVPFVSCLNSVSVTGLSIMCLLSILPVSLVCPFSVLFQSCLFLWFFHSVSYPNAACDWFAHYVSVPILPVSLVCPFCVLFQCRRLCLVFPFCVLFQY